MVCRWPVSMEPGSTVSHATPADVVASDSTTAGADKAAFTQGCV